MGKHSAPRHHGRAPRRHPQSPPTAGRTGLRRTATVTAVAVTLGLAGQSAALADDHGGWWRHWHRPADAAAVGVEAPGPRTAPTTPAAPAAPPGDGAALTGRPTATSTAYSAWAPHVRPVIADVVATYGVPTVYTRPGHSPTEQLAADFMVYGDRATGDAVAQYVLAHAAQFHVQYVIWRQHIHVVGGPGWQAMEDRGSPTANHMDHVHVSFTP
jgi:hypothetical protein